jgi:hypothetical protein
MLLVQKQRSLHGHRRRRRDRAMIGWLQRRIAVFAKLLTQSAHRPRREAKFEGNRGWSASLLKACENLLPQSTT